MNRLVVVFVVLCTSFVKAEVPDSQIQTYTLHPAVEVSDFFKMLERDWLRQAELRYSGNSAKNVSCEDDAAGAVDGIIDGKWGFHTEREPNPYWQVDLGESIEIGRVVLYNRCDSTGERNRYIVLSLSGNGKDWTKVWKNNGTMFYGATDSKPLVVDFSEKSLRGRFLRLSLEGTEYLHLDEVQVYKPNSDENIALHKTATQSSTSQWSARRTKSEEGSIPDFVFRKVLESGRQLADNLKGKGVDVTYAVQVFDDVEKSPLDVADYFRLRRTIRQLALSNPLIDFDEILFAKHAPAAFPHMSDQYYCFWQRGGGAIGILENIKSESPRYRNLTAHWNNGTFFRPELSYDGQRVLFAYSEYDPALADLPNKTDKSKIAENVFFHLYEMEIATGQTRKLTYGKYDDFDGRYLPDGDIIFLSTRKGRELQTTVLDVAEMNLLDLPNSYVRCGGDNFRPVPVFALHKIDPAGTRITQISAFENFEWTPALMSDGRIAYTRWDYIDRFNGDFFSLWATYPDGTKTSLIYGNYTSRPQVPIEPRAIPGSKELIFVAAAHHSSFGGSLVLLNPKLGQEHEYPIERLTPEVCFPETEGWPEHYYLNPLPLSRDYYLVSWSDKKLPPHSRVSNERENPSNSAGIYYYDRFGNLELLYRDERISSMNPIPLKSRPLPPTLPSSIDWDGVQEGEFMVQNIYEGLKDYGIAPDKHRIKSLRIIGVVPKVQPHMNSPVLGVSAEDPGKFVLGTVPVEDDGSAYFRAPSGIPYFFQALDEEGVMLQTMRSLVYLMPGEQAACIGCHENRSTVPSTSHSMPKAVTREPSQLRSEPSGTWPLRFSELVQPVLDKQCVSCHAPDSKDRHASALDLTAQHAYTSLISFHDNDLRKLAFERDRSIPGDNIAAKSRLMHVLLNPLQIPPHENVTLSRDELYRFIVWMDTYAQVLGSFSSQQEEELKILRKKYEHMFAP